MSITPADTPLQFVAAWAKDESNTRKFTNEQYDLVSQNLYMHALINGGATIGGERFEQKQLPTSTKALQQLVEINAVQEKFNHAFSRITVGLDSFEGQENSPQARKLQELASLTTNITNSLEDAEQKIVDTGQPLPASYDIMGGSAKETV